MNNIDTQYQNLLKDILENGVKKGDRTGTETISVFGRQIRHKMSEGFPMLTTKKMAWKTMVTELIWFLRGDTNIKYLVENNCHIWDGDAYKNYCKYDHYEPGTITKSTETRIEREIIKINLTQQEFINKIKTDDEFAKKWGELGPIYGRQWRSWYNDNFYKHITSYDRKTNEPEIEHKVNYIDQITNLINDLKTNPDSRRLMVNAWNVGELDQMVLPPCHYGFQVYTRELSEGERGLLLQPYGLDPLTKEGRDRLWKENNLPTRAISLMWSQRSVDTFLGLPFNIASYGLLLEIIAKEVNMVPDELIGNLGDTHLYSNHIEQAKEQISREPFELPKLNINTEFWKTESGECGVGLLNTNLKGFEISDFEIINYKSHPSIKAPLSN
jgi:thymidylate synthase